MPGDRCSIGGCRPDGTSEIQVRADWRRLEGRVVRRDGEYFWAPEPTRRQASSWPGASSSRLTTTGMQERLLNPGDVLPIEGSATMRIQIPSPLSATTLIVCAVLQFVGVKTSVTEDPSSDTFAPGAPLWTRKK